MIFGLHACHIDENMGQNMSFLISNFRFLLILATTPFLHNTIELSIANQTLFKNSRLWSDKSTNCDPLIMTMINSATICTTLFTKWKLSLMTIWYQIGYDSKSMNNLLTGPNFAIYFSVTIHIRRKFCVNLHRKLIIWSMIFGPEMNISEP